MKNKKSREPEVIETTEVQEKISVDTDKRELEKNTSKNSSDLIQLDPAKVTDPKKVTTVKIVSLNNLQLKTALGKKGQMIYNNEENIFMIFNGKVWKKLKAKPSNSIAD